MAANPTKTGTEKPISLRDHFAMAAMQGLVVAGAEDASYIAVRAYEVADAMMRLRGTA